MKQKPPRCPVPCERRGERDRTVEHLGNKQRLAKLERALKDFCARPCTFCWGDPFAALREEWEDDPDGPGFRRGSRTLLEEDLRRITDDLRCRRCGAKAKVFLLQTIKGVDTGGRP